MAERTYTSCVGGVYEIAKGMSGVKSSIAKDVR